jgi:hypothetical protein
MHDASSLEVEREANATPPDEAITTTFVSSSFLPPSASSSTPGPVATTSDTSNDTSPTSTPHGGNTPTGSVVVPGRDRSGTVVARPVWDTTLANRNDSHARRRSTLPAAAPTATTSTAASTSARTDTEPESEADAEMEDAAASAPASTTPPAPAQVHAPPRHTPAPPSQQGRRAVGIVGDDDAAALEVNLNLNMLLAGVDDGFVALEQNVGDDLALGAPPGAPGNMNVDMGQNMVPMPPVPLRDRREGRREQQGMEDLSPRAGLASLPDAHAHPTHHSPAPARTPATAAQSSAAQESASHAHETGPYREEDVLLSLQLLAYLSKYPHVRQAFYKPRAVFNPALQVRAFV